MFMCSLKRSSVNNLFFYGQLFSYVRLILLKHEPEHFGHFEYFSSSWLFVKLTFLELTISPSIALITDSWCYFTKILSSRIFTNLATQELIKEYWLQIIDIKRENRFLKVCYVPTTSAGLPRLLFLRQPLILLTNKAGSTHHLSVYCT